MKFDFFLWIILFICGKILRKLFRRKGEQNMSILAQWENEVNKERDQDEHEAFWKEYLQKEKEIYQSILESKQNVIESSISEFADKYKTDKLWVVGFLDGINTSLQNSIDLNLLTDESSFKLDIIFEKLLYNMHGAKADWLYSLEEWNEILPIEKRKEIEKEYKQSQIVHVDKIGRNDPCTCGSGKKHKKCCGM